MKEIEIESDSVDITLKGTESIIYFNKKNTALKTSLYNRVVFDYLLKLKPNRIYRVTKYMGSDRGNLRITFKTDDSRKIISASDINCN